MPLTCLGGGCNVSRANSDHKVHLSRAGDCVLIAARTANPIGHAFEVFELSSQTEMCREMGALGAAEGCCKEQLRP